MRVIGLMIVFLLAFCVFHFTMAGVVHFVTLEANYLNIWDWQSSSRFIWLFFGGLFSLVVAGVIAQLTVSYD